jgi:hypothetical protein
MRIPRQSEGVARGLAAWCPTAPKGVLPQACVVDSVPAYCDSNTHQWMFANRCQTLPGTPPVIVGYIPLGSC